MNFKTDNSLKHSSKNQTEKKHSENLPLLDGKYNPNKYVAKQDKKLHKKINKFVQNINSSHKN